MKSHDAIVCIIQYVNVHTSECFPGHVGLIGHDQADQEAKDKARSGKPAEQWSRLTCVKQKLVETQAQELTRWHETKEPKNGI